MTEYSIPTEPAHGPIWDKNMNQWDKKDTDLVWHMYDKLGTTIHKYWVHILQNYGPVYDTPVFKEQDSITADMVWYLPDKSIIASPHSFPWYLNCDRTLTAPGATYTDREHDLFADHYAGIKFIVLRLGDNGLTPTES